MKALGWICWLIAAIATAGAMDKGPTPEGKGLIVLAVIMVVIGVFADFKPTKRARRTRRAR
jgi:hypothetical protein